MFHDLSEKRGRVMLLYYYIFCTCTQIIFGFDSNQLYVYILVVDRPKLEMIVNTKMLTS